jgi:hypothetical protein
MSPVIDFSQVKGLELLPEGEYLAKVVHAEEGISKSQYPKIDVRWEIIAPEEHAGRQIFDSLSFHPDAVWKTKLKLVGMGFGDDFNGEVTAESLMDKEAAITLAVQANKNLDEDGNPYPDRNNVRKVRSASKYGSKAGAAALEALETEEIAPATPKARKNR